MSDCSCEKQDSQANCCGVKALQERVVSAEAKRAELSDALEDALEFIPKATVTRELAVAALGQIPPKYGRNLLAVVDAARKYRTGMEVPSEVCTIAQLNKYGEELLAAIKELDRVTIR